MGRTIAVLALVLLAARASAQQLPEWLRVRESYLGYQQLVLDAHAAKLRRRSAWMVAVGAGISAGAVTYLALEGGRNSCAYDDRRIRGVLPIGIGLAAVGAA